MFENQAPAKVQRKSQSATNLCPSTGPCIDIVTNHEGPPTYKPKHSTASLKTKDQKPVKHQGLSENLAKNKTPNTVDRSCTCCVRVNKTDAETQYELSVETFVPTSYEAPGEASANTPQVQVLKNFSIHVHTIC